MALVTGAASGIGAACARRFAAEGAAVLLADVDGPPAPPSRPRSVRGGLPSSPAMSPRSPIGADFGRSFSIAGEDSTSSTATPSSRSRAPPRTRGVRLDRVQAVDLEGRLPGREDLHRPARGHRLGRSSSSSSVNALVDARQARLRRGEGGAGGSPPARGRVRARGAGQRRHRGRDPDPALAFGARFTAPRRSAAGTAAKRLGPTPMRWPCPRWPSCFRLRPPTSPASSFPWMGAGASSRTGTPTALPIALAGRRAIVTGAAGGLGKAIARACAEAGATSFGW